MDTVMIFNRDVRPDSESWTNQWIYRADADRQFTEEEVQNFANNCLAEVERHHAYAHGGENPGGVFHHRPYIDFAAANQHACRVAVVIISQYGGYDI